MTKEKILIVDDSPTNVKFIKMFLLKEGYKIYVAENGIEALQILKKENIDLVITDIVMPKMDGYELCAKMKINKETKEIPIIVITALSETEDKVKTLDSGADEFLSKPFNSIELIARVKSLLRGRKYYRQIIKQNLIYEKELNIAKIVQESILPKNEPQVDNMLFASKYIPAYFIGGDYYNYNQIDEKKLSIFISDVMGHGVISSLVTMILKSNFDNLTEYYNIPSDLLKMLNKRIYDSISDSMIYSTGIYAIIDIEKMKLTYSCAGHPPFYKIDSNGELSSYKTSGGVLGLFEEMEYIDESLKLEKGDTLIFYTDGVTEVTNKEGVEFGEYQFIEEIKKAPQYSHPEEFIENLIESIKRYGNKKEFEDDINLIVFKCI
ncbi:MAG: SpoIIE family protein phosphatase [Spirochaetota bacterium]